MLSDVIEGAPLEHFVINNKRRNGTSLPRLRRRDNTVYVAER